MASIEKMIDLLFSMEVGLGKAVLSSVPLTEESCLAAIIFFFKVLKIGKSDWRCYCSRL